MPDLPINKRPYRTFLSHAHVDKGFVDQVHSWLTKVANMEVWYDSDKFPSGLFAIELGKAIEDCQSAIIVLSEDSIRSGWVEEEWNISVAQQKAAPDFQVILLNLDQCVPPASLRVRKWIEVQNGNLTPHVACQVLEALHYHSTGFANTSSATFYLSRGSAPSEVQNSEKLLIRCRNMGCRFVRDAPDQLKFDDQRIKDIIASTRGLFAFVPSRQNGKTSPYVLNEIRFAKELNIPAVVVLDAGLSPEVSAQIELPAQRLVFTSDKVNAGDIDEQLQEFIDHAPNPRRGAHCFLGHALDKEQTGLWTMGKRVAEAVSGLECISGDEIEGNQIQEQIVERIRASAISIFDITDDRLNSCIEAGIARGAGVNYELVCKGPRHGPDPFMFKDKQIFYYDTPTDLLGLVRRLVFKFRRVIC